MKSLPISLLLLLTACASTPDTPTAVNPPACVGADCEKPNDEGSDIALRETMYEVESLPLKFSSQGDELAGELVLPKGVAGPLPAALIIHDFGAMGRDGVMKTSFGVELPVEVPVYRTLAEELAGHGIAVMIYDKRTCTLDAAPWCKYPRSYVEGHAADLPNILTQDAANAFDFLATQAQVDPSQLVVIGHGEGAMYAANLNAKTLPKARVLMNLSGYAADELILHQTEQSIETITTMMTTRKSSAETDEMAKQLAELKNALRDQTAAFQKVRKLADPPETFGLPGKLWKHLISAQNKALKMIATPDSPPCLVLQGDEDLGYPDDNQTPIESVITSPHQLQVLEGVGHLLVDIEGDSTRVSEDVHEAIIQFLAD